MLIWPQRRHEYANAVDKDDLNGDAEVDYIGDNDVVWENFEDYIAEC